MNLTFAGYKKREGLNLVHRHFSEPFVVRLLSPLSLSKLIRKQGDRRGKKSFSKVFLAYGLHFHGHREEE